MEESLYEDLLMSEKRGINVQGKIALHYNFLTVGLSVAEAGWFGEHW